MNQHFFDVPFAFSGDVTAIPDPLQTGGTVSFTEGWNYNYQRDLTTDPAALPIDRSTMNWLFLQITTALQALQKETVPEWITAAQNGGTALSYGLGAVVLYSASGNAPFTKYVSLLAGNTDTPGATANWQVVCDPIATSAQASAGTNNASIMTPLLVAQQTALRALLAGSSSQVFNVQTATAATHAVPLAQAQGMQGNFTTVYAINASTTFTAAQLSGAAVNCFGGAPLTITLPTITTIGTGKFAKVYNYGSSTVTIATNGTSGDFIYAGTNLTSVTLQPGDDIELLGRGSQELDIVGGSAARQFFPLIVGFASQSAQAAQLGQLLAARGNLGPVPVSINANTTLAVSQAGSSVQWYGAAGGIITLPPATLMPSGGVFWIYNQGLGAIAVNVNGGSDYISAGNPAGLINSITLQRGDTIALLARGGTEWDAISGSALQQFNPLLLAAVSGPGASTCSATSVRANLTAASASLTVTADEITMGTALGGTKYTTASFSGTINLATTGAGGMDTGSAPASGYVAIYAIYNPATGAKALLGRNATSAVAPAIYGGSNMPSGYTASLLVSVWPTNASSQFIVAAQIDRSISFNDISVASSSGTVAGSSISIAAAVPINAKTWGGNLSITLSSTGAGAFRLYSNSSLIGDVAVASLSNNAGTGGTGSGFSGLLITTTQQAYITVIGSATVSNFSAAATNYTF